MVCQSEKFNKILYGIYGVSTQNFKDLMKSFLENWNRRVHEWKGLRETGFVVVVCVNMKKARPCSCKSISLHYYKLADEVLLQRFISDFKKCRKTR